MNKHIKILLSICIVVLMTFECNIASARTTSFSMGKALSTGSQEAIVQAKSTFNAYHVGQVVDLSPATNITKQMRLIKTVGQVNETTVIKSGLNFSHYINNVRGLNATAGKIFEESYRRSFNVTMVRQNQNYMVEATSILGQPHDSADLLLINKQTGQVEMKIQQKLSASAAVDAIVNPKQIKKYVDCTILTTRDELANIKRHLPRYSSAKRKLIERALKSGKLTDTITGVSAKSKAYYQEATQRLYSSIFKKTSTDIASKLAKVIRVGDKYIQIGDDVLDVGAIVQLYFNTHEKDKEAMQEIDTAWNYAKQVKQIKLLKICNKLVGVVGSIVDIGYGTYMIYSGESQFEKGLLDADLSNYKKILGAAAQIAVGTVSIITVFAEPFGAIVAPVVVVVGTTIATLDKWINYIQTQRVAARQRLLERVTAQEKPDAVRKLLLREMEIQCTM